MSARGAEMGLSAPAVNVAARLSEAAGRMPGAAAVAVQRGSRYHVRTFAELEEESARLAAGLARLGAGRGTRVALMVPPGLEFFALAFALLRAGAVPVLLDPGMGLRALKRCLEEAAPRVFIGSPKAQMARILLGWARGSLSAAVTVGRRWGWGGLTLASLRAADAPPGPAEAATRGDETAAILFTSGSTGLPKGAVYTHAMFAAQVGILREVYGIEPGERDLATFPLFALFGPALGMTAVVPEMDASRPARADPRKLFEAAKDWECTNLFASPALLDRLGRYGEAHGLALPALRRALSAGAPVRPEVLERFVKLLPASAEVFTPYGATEALPVCSIGSREILGETRARTAEGQGICVGRPVGGAEVAVIAIADRPLARWEDARMLPPGAIGEIAVRGRVVSRAYVNRPDHDARSKIADGQGGVWHRMGDAGYCDAQGRLWFCGRVAHRVITRDATLFTVPCEAVFNAHPRVFRSALVGVGPSAARRPVLCVELEEGAPRRGAAREALRRELLELGARNPLTRGIREILFHDRFPVDVRHNAKIFREKLAVWAAGRLP